MGAYDSRFTGEIRINPPLTWAEVRSATHPVLYDVALGLDERAEDTPTGQIRTILAVAITPIRRSAYNGYEIETEIQAVIDGFPDHEFTGAITAQPEDPAGLARRQRGDDVTDVAALNRAASRLNALTVGAIALAVHVARHIRRYDRLRQADARDAAGDLANMQLAGWKIRRILNTEKEQQ